MAFERNNQNPANAMPIWETAPPGSPGVPTSAVAPSNLRKQIIEALQADVRIGPAAAGSWVGFIIMMPLTASPGAVTMKDGSAGSSVTIFAGGAGSVVDLSPRALPPFGYGSEATGVFITTGANMRVFVYGNWAN